MNKKHDYPNPEEPDPLDIEPDEDILPVKEDNIIANEYKIEPYANLSNLNLTNAKLTCADLTNSDLSNANLEGAKLRYANLEGADLTGAKLSGANLSGADLSGANLEGAILTGAKLLNVDLSDANLRYAKLEGADLTGAKLSNADLTGANLSNANLHRARGIVQIDMKKRTLYANMRQNENGVWYAHVYNGCWNDYASGTIDELEEAVNQEYGNDSHYHVLEIPYLRAWEKLELKRLQEIEK